MSWLGNTQRFSDCLWREICFLRTVTFGQKGLKLNSNVLPKKKFTKHSSTNAVLRLKYFFSERTLAPSTVSLPLKKLHNRTEANVHKINTVCHHCVLYYPIPFDRDLGQVLLMICFLCVWLLNRLSLRNFDTWNRLTNSLCNRKEKASKRLCSSIAQKQKCHVVISPTV